MGSRSNCLFTTMNPASISISSFTYDLPEDRIALHPLPQRDASKLLLYKNGVISETIFSNIADHLPESTLLIVNTTRVINARIRFTKTTGAAIEVFCLEPQAAVKEYSTVMAATGSSTWKCLVGGAAKWKNEILEKNTRINGQDVLVKAAMLGKLPEAYSIQLSWEPAHHSFASVIEAAGDIPLPPYIKRSTGMDDTSRYQTIFAGQDGSVAAPTAGLHFTEAIFKKLAAKNIMPANVTLHVGAGTFKPVKAATMQHHEMHAEYINVDIGTIKKLRGQAGNIAAVGTTSCRTIESLYWMGVKAFLDPGAKDISIKQWDVYTTGLSSANIKKEDSLDALARWMEANHLENIFTQTQLMIAPGYRFRLINILVTNFHQPQSTLLLLVAAAIGNNWRKMYDYALSNGFRFLSYGDANLIFLDQNKL